jgi:hypothetical protein
MAMLNNQRVKLPCWILLDHFGVYHPILWTKIDILYGLVDSGTTCFFEMASSKPTLHQMDFNSLSPCPTWNRPFGRKITSINGLFPEP